MKTCLVECLKNIKTIVFYTSFFVLVFFVNTVQAGPPNSLQLNLEQPSFYPNVLEEILPSIIVEDSNNKNAYKIVDDGGIAEAFDVQALAGIESGLVKYWYPQYLATVIIAIDNDQSDKLITTWSDLLTTEEEVAFLGQTNSLQMQVAAIAYGLEGQGYSLNKAIDLLSRLHKKNLLVMNSSTAPITICYDYEALALNQAGRNLTIIVPGEGTLTYQKGLLSNQKLDFKGDVNKLLIDNKLRPLDDQGDISLYPDKMVYGKARQVIDFEHFNTHAQRITRRIERDVLGKKYFMSINYQEHLLFILIYLILVTIWTGSMIQRSTQKSIQYAVLMTGFILTGWTLVRLIKYQIIGTAILSRYLWYSYYIFQLSLPLVILWMAWAIDKPKDESFPPKWWWVIFIINSFLVFLVFTNDLHGHVFQLDLTRSDWDINYSYGLGYYMILLVCMGILSLAFLIMLVKGMKSPRKKGFVVPLLLFVLFGVYNYQYIVRNPIVYETDITIVTGSFAMLLFETGIRFGLIPTNSKYIDLFERSPLKIQILNKDKERVLASESANIVSPSILDQILRPGSNPLLDGDTLVLANPIPGGYAVWHEDMSKINNLYQEIQNSTDNLKEANALLDKEVELKRVLNEQLAKKELIQQFEAEIAQRIQELSEIVETMSQASDCTKETTRVAILLTYIKRRSNFFFMEKKEETIDIEQFIVYIDELSKVAQYADVELAMINEIKTSISCRHASLFYDFFYEVLNKGIERGCTYFINYLEDKGQLITMNILPSGDIGNLKLDPQLNQAIIDSNGFILSKDLEDTMGISISFSKEETLI